MPLLLGFSESTSSVTQDLSPLIWTALLLALVVGGSTILASSYGGGGLPTARLGLVGMLVRVAAALAGAVLVWAAFPTRHLAPTVRNGNYGLFPNAVTELWVGVCLVALGLVVLLCSWSVLPLQRGKSALAGLAAGTLVVVLVWGMTPALTRALMIEHTTVDAVGASPPVPATVSRVGWSWQPEHPVVGVERGPVGPIVRYADGFVALEGASGEELWTYRRPYARRVETGLFAGNERYAYLLYVAESQPEPQTRTMVVLDTATGQVVREAPMPALAEEGEEEPADFRYLTPDVRVFFVYEDGQPLVVAHATDSAERVWEFPLEDEPAGRLCLWARSDGIRGFGDRVLVARLCLDEEHVGEQGSSALAQMDVPDDAEESVTALDAATGQQVWRQAWTPDDLPHVAVPGIGTVREADGGEPVAVTRGGTFALADGAPVPARLETPQGATDRTLAVDTDGAVVLRGQGVQEPALLLHTDAEGGVFQRGEIDRDTFVRGYAERASVLGEALVMPSNAYDSLDRQVRALTVVPLGAGAGEGARIGFDGELLPELTESWQREAEHRVLVVPGAVVSYLGDPNEPAIEPVPPIHGLVP
ncbi:PQQ-binding-like beta-propeller repeat protein [Nocardiopsis aegyptia]|uniref:outer membrane protein assembly factor BamB family protein n=1 Tax=Nocardiopsis aegyptia TaxID=220378 RepID=UPI003672FC80